jgi:outer membrane protein assembly factor BamB
MPGGALILWFDFLYGGIWFAADNFTKNKWSTNMKHNLVKEGLLITTVLCLFLAMAGAASAAHSVTTERTISPTTVMAGDSFNVSVKIVITGPIENYKNISMATVKEDYSAVSDWPNWNISEGNWYADDPFDNVFRNGLSNESHQEALFEFSTEGEALYWLYSDGGTFYVNYTMTTSPNAAAGVQEIGGYYIDPDYSRTGYVGYNVYPTGDHSVTIERDPITSLSPSMTFAEIQDAFDQAEPGDTVYFNDGYYDLSGEGAGFTLDIPAGLTLTASSAENVVVDLGTDMQLVFGIETEESGLTAPDVMLSGPVGIGDGTINIVPLNNTTATYVVDNLTAAGVLAVLNDSELITCEIWDYPVWHYEGYTPTYIEYMTLTLESLNGISTTLDPTGGSEGYGNGTGWFMYLNGEITTDLPLPDIEVEYGDVVTFLYMPYEYVPYDPYLEVDEESASYMVEVVLLPSTGELTVENLTFEGNASESTAGMTSLSGNAVVRNCVFNDVFLSFSDPGGLVSGNTFDGAHIAVGYDGVTATSASNLVISDNIFTNATSRGTNAFENASLLLVGASNITVSGNEFSDNLMAVALRSFATYRLTDCTLYDNVFDSNDVAIMGFNLGSSDSGNRMYLNNFVGNTNTFADSDCDSSVPILYASPAAVSYIYADNSYSNVLGNYYDDYAGADSTPVDGIGDTPYATFLSGQDTGPLMGEWNAADNEISEPAIVAPVADFSADVTSGEVPLTVNFTDASTDAESWSWDFDGDGVEDSNETNPQFTYDEAGTYNVSLTVSNSEGSDTKTIVDYIAVTAVEPSSPSATIGSVGDLYTYITWTEADNVSSITAYNIYRSTTSGAETLYDTVNAGTSGYTDHAVTNGQEYFYKISAVNEIGESALSNEITATPMPSLISDDVWRQFMGDVQHTGYSSTPGPKTNTTTWESPAIDAEDGTSVAIAEDLGLLFVISDTKDNDWTPTMGYNNLSALNINDGSVAWDITFGNMSQGTYNSNDSWATPAYHNGVVFTAGDGARYANNGTLKWGTLPINTNGGPIVVDGKVIIGNWDGEQYFCFDEETGTELWNISVDGNAQGTPAYNNSHLFLTSYNEVNCVDMDGNIVWTRSIDNVMGSATVQYGMVYITTYDSGYTSDQYVYALKENTGDIVWQATMTDQSMMGTDCTPAVAYGYVYVTAGMAMIDQNTYCFDAFTGEVVWSSSEAGSWFTSPVVSDGVVYAGAESYFTGGGGMGSFTHIAALDAFTGDLIWESDNGGSTPAIHDGVLYTVGFKKVYAFSTNALPVLSFAPGDVSVAENHYTEINITVSSLPEGLSGYNFTVTIDDPAVADIVDIKYPAWANLTENSSLPGSSVYLKTADITSQVGAGEENIVLATITVSGNEMGSASLTLDVHRFDDDNGSEIEAELAAGTLEVTMVAIPGQTASPQDLDGDGFYEDLTGDGSFSFVDVEVFFHQMDWIEDNLLIEDFDLNGNGRIDFDDIVDMFQMLA